MLVLHHGQIMKDYDYEMKKSLTPENRCAELQELSIQDILL